MKMTLGREFYVPTNKPNLERHEDTELGLEFYLYDHEATGRPVIKAFSGKKAKADFWEIHLNVEKRAERLERWIAAHRAKAETKAARTAERRAPHSFVVGDIIACAWGYSMSLASFYKVIAVTPNGLTLQEIGQQTAEGTFDAGRVIPDEAETKGQPFKVRCGADNRPKVMSHAWGYKWDGNSIYVNRWD